MAYKASREFRKLVDSSDPYIHVQAIVVGGRTRQDALAIDGETPGLIDRGRSTLHSTPATANFAGILEAHTQRLVSEGLAVEAGDGCSSFMSFHFDKSKSSAFTRKDISS